MSHDNPRLLTAFLAALAAAPLLAQPVPPGAGADAPWRSEARWDAVDEEGTAEIHRHTTDPRYLTPLVSYIPEHPTVPSPRDVLGYVAGTEGRLTPPEEEHGYFEALAQASPRVALHEMGRTEEGRRMLLVIVTAETNMDRLEELKGYTRALADPRSTGESEALALLDDALPIVHVTAGLHSPETGSPEMVMELAYRLAVSEHPDVREIRDRVVLLVTPVTEVDGRARMVDWYYRYLDEYDNRHYMPPTSPPYWGAYAFHDNNRDGIQMTLALTRHYNDSFWEWHPTYSLDLHESVPLLYVSTGTGPYNETLDPITITEWQWIANWEITELNKHGLPGVWTWGFYTGWNPSYLLWVTNNHNSLGRFYETFGNGTARTLERDLEDASYAGKSVTSRQWYRASPPPEKLTWSLRNNNNYMQSGVLATLTLAARNGRSLLYNFWKKGRNSLERGRTEPPHAWVIPHDQPARARTAYLLNQLQRHHIEVHRAGAAFEVEEGSFARGDFLVRLDQPYGDFARNLLRITKFPEDAEQRPYDDVSWTLGELYRVTTTPISDPAILDVAALEPLVGEVRFAGTVHGGGAKVFAVPHDGSNTIATLRYRLRDFPALAAEQRFEAADRSFPAGTLLLEAREGLRPALEEALEATMLDAWSLPELPDVPKHELDLPRLALYHTWTSTQADGWVRYALGEAGIDFHYINDDDLRAGGLGGRFDVILIAHQGRASLKRLIHGRDPKFGPQPWQATDEHPSHGRIDSSPDITGGMGFEGLGNLESFLDAGGTLVLLGSSGVLATDSGLLRNVSSSGGVSTPGSTLRTRVLRRDHPIAYGYDDVATVFRINGPVYTVPERYEHWIVVQYGAHEKEEEDAEPGAEGESEPEEEPVAGGEPASAGDEPAPGAGDGEPAEGMLVTGLLSGDKQLEHRAAVLDVPRHRGGRIVLYSFNPLHRYLNHGDHNYVFNALLHWNDFPEPQPREHGGLARD